MNLLTPFVPSSGAKAKFLEVLREKVHPTLIQMESNNVFTNFLAVLRHGERKDHAAAAGKKD